MRYILLITLILLLAGCTFAAPFASEPAVLPTAIAQATATVSAPAIPTPVPPERIYVELFIALSDANTEQPVVAETVWLNDEVAYRNVKAFTLLLEGDYPPTQDGYEIRIKADGYREWSTRIRPRPLRSQSLSLFVHLHPIKPQSRMTDGSLMALTPG